MAGSRPEEQDLAAEIVDVLGAPPRMMTGYTIRTLCEELAEGAATRLSRQGYPYMTSDGSTIDTIGTDGATISIDLSGGWSLTFEVVPRGGRFRQDPDRG